MALLGSPEQARKLSFEDMYRHLASPVLSHSHRFRLKALHVLLSPLVRRDPTQELVVSKLLQAEEVPIDAQSSRERVLRVTQLERVIPPGDTVVSELAVCWLVAQLKVGLRPVWLPTAQALQNLSERCAEIVWRIMFGELKAANASSSVDHVPNCVDDGPCNADEVREGERSWRDPSAHKIRSVLAKWHTQDTFRLQLIQVCSAHRFARDPLDVLNVESATPRPT
jgi:U3 small nucleolar RNA-associated protein 20